MIKSKWVLLTFFLVDFHQQLLWLLRRYFLLFHVLIRPWHRQRLLQQIDRILLFILNLLMTFLRLCDLLYHQHFLMLLCCPNLLDYLTAAWFGTLFHLFTNHVKQGNIVKHVVEKQLRLLIERFNVPSRHSKVSLLLRGIITVRFIPSQWVSNIKHQLRKITHFYIASSIRVKNWPSELEFL